MDKYFHLLGIFFAGNSPEPAVKLARQVTL